MTAGPLARYTVLDLTRVRAGPTAVRYFADWGANVIKVEMPPSAGEMDMGGPRHGPDFQNLHRNKRSITLNLKEPEGKAIFLKLVEKADVGGRELPRRREDSASGIDYESLKKVESAHHPGIDLGASARTGRMPSGAGFDQIAPGHGRHHVGHRPSRAAARCAPASPSPTWAPGLHCAIGS
jgi:formyl-CoA transferase